MPLNAGRRWPSAAAAAGALSLLLAPIVVLADQAPSSVHVVQAGETLSQIALDTGVDAASLSALNGLDDANFVVVGQTLRLAGPAAPAAAPSPASAYTVADGDTLWSIAQRFGTTTDALVQLNQLDDANRLKLGAMLTVPGSGTAAPAPAANAPAPAPSAAPPSPGTTSAPASTAVASGSPATSARRSLLVPYTVQA